MSVSMGHGISLALGVAPTFVSSSSFFFGQLYFGRSNRPDVRGSRNTTPQNIRQVHSERTLCTGISEFPAPTCDHHRESEKLKMNLTSVTPRHCLLVAVVGNLEDLKKKKNLARCTYSPNAYCQSSFHRASFCASAPIVSTNFEAWISIGTER